MRPPKPLPANVVLNNTRPVLATATENGLSLMKPVGTVTFCCSTPVVRSTTEMLLPPKFATYSVAPSGLTSRPVGCEPTAIGVWSSSSAIENTSTRLLVAFVRYTCEHASSKIASVRRPVTATARGVANPTAHAACARAGDASNHAAARYGSADASRRSKGEIGDTESPLLRTRRAFAPRAATTGAQVQAVGLNVKARCEVERHAPRTAHRNRRESGPPRSTRSNEPRPAARDERVDRVEAPDGGADLVGEGAPTGD